MSLSLVVLSALAYTARAQLAGTLNAETHPPLTWSKCTSGGCTQVNGGVTMDANWRWVHDKSGQNCYTGNTWNTQTCTDNAACAAACALDGAQYASTYGVTTSGDAMTIDFVTRGANTNIGSRLYLMADDSTYETFTLAGNEFTFDVDVSQLPCGLNGALYFVSMDADGGMAKYPTNKAGAKYGTGYCDSQCPRDLKFINGEANVEGWVPASNNPNTGLGSHGSCCPEMDIWEANSVSQALTPHPCDGQTQTMCSGATCGGTYSGSGNRYKGTCDPDGCDFNPYREDVTDFYGPGMTIDTNSKFTVVTQFVGSPVTAINRQYVQNGKVIAQTKTNVPGLTGNSITADFCTAQKNVFGDTNSWDQHGGLPQMSLALEAPMVLVLSLWDDYYSNMLWLDSTYPTTDTGPGAARGSCGTDSGVPASVEQQSPNAKVIYSNIKFGPIGSTYAS